MQRKQRKKSSNPSIQELERIGKQFYTTLLQTLMITLVTTIVYMMFFPAIIPYLLDISNVEGTLPIFPDLSQWITYFGLYSSLTFFFFHIFIIRIFIQNNRVFFIGIISGLASMGVHLLLSQFIYGLLSFIYGISFATPQGFFANFDIQTLNLLGLIILYDIMFILLVLILIRKQPINKNGGNK